MADLYYIANYGITKKVSDGDITLAESECSKKWNERKFSLFVFNEEASMKEDDFGDEGLKCAQSRLFPDKDLIANLHCTFVDKDTDDLPSEHLKYMCKLADDICGIKNSHLVVVEGAFGFQNPDYYYPMNSDDIADLYKNLYSIIKQEISNKYGVGSDIMVCWEIPDADYDSFRDRFQYREKLEPIDCKVKFSNYRIVLFY